MNTTSCIPCDHYKKDFNTEPCKSCKDHDKQEQRKALVDFTPWTPPFKFEITSIFDSKGHRVCDLRGWGFLTGGGACNLPDEEASKIQDAMGDKIALMMNVGAGL